MVPRHDRSAACRSDDGRQARHVRPRDIALALGIGLTTVMFSIVNGVILRGLPFAESDRLYHFARLNLANNSDDGDEAATLHD